VHVDCSFSIFCRPKAYSKFCLLVEGEGSLFFHFLSQNKRVGGSNSIDSRTPRELSRTDHLELTFP
jgi:hypothetical protein